MRPTVDMSEPGYQELLRQRQMRRLYGAYWKDMMWVEEALARIEKSLKQGSPTADDCADFYKVKETHARVFAKAGNLPLGASAETAENHTTPLYIWRTQHDGKVRPSHAANEGKIFAWVDPPPTGNPGEDYGCRCRAEPYNQGEGEMREYRTQVVTYAAPDASSAWTQEDFAHHYFFGKGQPVTLDEIGHLQDVIGCAKTHNQTAAGGGTIFNRVTDQILEAARQKGEGSFSDHFLRWYEFQDFVWSLGGATIASAFSANAIEKGDFLIVTSDIEYTFTDTFTNPLDLPEGKGEYKGWDLPFSTPYLITGTWSTRFEAVIRK